MNEIKLKPLQKKHILSPLRDIERPLELFGRIMSTIALLYFFVFSSAVILVIESGYIGGQSRQFDFVAFWAAAKLALAGDPLSAFDQTALRRAQELPPDAPQGEMYWFYPPGLQWLFAPFAMMRYWVAWLLFDFFSLWIFIVALWRPARVVPMGQNLILGAPIVIIVFRLGQLAVLWSGVLVLALHAMTRGKPALAGLLIGLLSLKPQLGILIPLALIAGRRWDVILWSCVSLVFVHGIPTLVVGIDYWHEFFDRMHFAAAGLDSNFTRHDLMVSPYAFLRLLGLDHDLSIYCQIIVSGLVGVGLMAAWSRKSACFDLLTGVLCVAIPIASPYSFYYELALCIPAAIFLVRGGYGAGTLDRILLCLAVIGPAAFFISTPLAPLFAPILLAIFIRAVLMVIDADQKTRGRVEASR